MWQKVRVNMNINLYNEILKQRKEAENQINKLNEGGIVQERAIRYNQGIMTGLDIALELISKYE